MLDGRFDPHLAAAFAASARDRGRDAIPGWKTTFLLGLSLGVIAVACLMVLS